MASLASNSQIHIDSRDHVLRTHASFDFHLLNWIPTVTGQTADVTVDLRDFQKSAHPFGQLVMKHGIRLNVFVIVKPDAALG